MAFDVYSYRPVPPEHWIEPMKQWGRQVQGTGRLKISCPDGVTLCKPLSDRGALDAWIPLDFMRMQQDDGRWTLETRREIADKPGVLIAWIDGALHDGVPPRQLSDLLHLYRVARLTMEAFFDAGVLQVLDDLRPAQASASLN
jgi:hypothetical protein